MRWAAAALVLLMIGVYPTTSHAAVPGKEFTETGCEEYSDAVARLYTAGLGREPERGGFEFWMTEYTAGRWLLPKMATFFTQSPEFQRSYGTLTQDGFIRQLYRNVLGREGEQGGVTFWNQQMSAGMDRGTVLLRFSESPENIERSRTTEPALGPFNAGLSGPWTCTGPTQLSDLEWLTTYYPETSELLGVISDLVDGLSAGMAPSECAAMETAFVERFGPGDLDFAAKLRRASPELEETGGRVFGSTLAVMFACRQGLQGLTQSAVDLLTVALRDFNEIVADAAGVVVAPPPGPVEEPPPAGPNVSQQNAIATAESYLRFSSFSRSSLIDQLEFEGFSTADATFAVDYLDIDFNEQAVEQAASYLDFMPFSRLGLIDQLEFEGFTTAQAIYGTDAQGTDYNRQAELMAADYLDFMPFSCQGLIDQLEFEQFTTSQATHGAQSTGVCG